MDFTVSGRNSEVKRRAAKQNANIDVKEMRKKFEENGSEKRNSYLEISDSSKVKEDLPRSGEKKILKLKVIDSDESIVLESDNLSVLPGRSEGTPRVPVRRNRNKPLNLQKMRAVRASKSPDTISSPDLIEKQVNRISVRERSKLFESENSNSNLNNQIADQTSVTSKRKTNFLIAPELPQPPAKPPRTPHKNQFYESAVSTSSNTNDVKADTEDTLQKLMDLNMNIATMAKTNALMTNRRPAGNSLSLNGNHTTTKVPFKPAPRLLSAPEIHVNMSRNKDDLLHTKGPKISTYTNKAKIFNFRFSNLSTVVQDIRERVTNKSLNKPENSVPQTDPPPPPPKKYRTLRRSFSDDHIYAEPFETESVKPQRCHASSDADVLHYMCTPLVDRDFGDERFLRPPSTEDQNSSDCVTNDSRPCKLALRKIIYESFSMLRRIPENNLRTDGNVNGDSESDVSAKDVAERITYVKSMKKQASTSSICISPKLFDAILILNISETGPQVLYKQSKAQTQFDYPLIQHLCFPDYKNLRKSEVYKSEWFQFTLMHGDNEKSFGYCYRILGWSETRQGFCRKLPVAICILSGIRAPLFYKKILVEIEKHLVLSMNRCKEYLRTLQKLGVPNAGASLSIPDNVEDKSSQTVISRPLDSHTVGMELTRSLQLLDGDVLLKAIASLLLERRVLMLSNNTQNLLHCCTAVSSLIYPFQWQHLLMPIVPGCLAVQCCIESPYLLGIMSSNHDDILDLLGEQQVFVVDTDKGSILKSFGDEDTILPKKVQKAVICALNLAKNMTDPTEMMRDIMISEAIVHMFVELLGHCQNHFLLQNGCFIFQKEAFQKNSPSRSIQSFLEWFSETQMFEAFIEECIWRKTYRDICQSQLLTFFEKRVEEYNWELAYNNERITRKIVKRVHDFGEKLKGLAKP